MIEINKGCGPCGVKVEGWLQFDVHEIYIINYSHICIFSITFLLFCNWLSIIIFLEVIKGLHANRLYLRQNNGQLSQANLRDPTQTWSEASKNKRKE